MLIIRSLIDEVISAESDHTVRNLPRDVRCREFIIADDSHQCNGNPLIISGSLLDPIQQAYTIRIRLLVLFSRLEYPILSEIP